MSGTMLISSLHSALPPLPCFSSGNRPPRKMGLDESPRRRRPLKIFASCDHDNYDGKLVDEDMIGLRIRIHDMKMGKMNGDDQPPSNWMQWEKRYYANYNSDIYEGVGLLQTQLMNTRPSLALGMLALITLCVPMSIAALMLPFLDIFKAILANGIH